MDSTTLRSALESLSPKKPVCVNADVSLADVIGIMKNNHFGCVCVTVNNVLAGIVTERDILTKVVGGGLDVEKTSAAEVMTHDLECLFPDDEIAFAINRMAIGGFRHVPLVNLQGSPTGIISCRDILGFLSSNITPESSTDKRGE